MRKILILGLFTVLMIYCEAQKACSDENCRKFDFWVGSWKVYDMKGNLAGTSKISLILDSCVILEEWTSSSQQFGIYYQGKSFNLYNRNSKQWQQTWVDNTGTTTEFLSSEVSINKIVFYADKVVGTNGKTFKRKLSFTKLEDATVRQFGEVSYDEGITWQPEYNLLYKPL